MRLPSWGRTFWKTRGAALARRGVGVALVCALSGCIGAEARRNQELLEADLRSQERHIQEMKEDLDRKEGVIHNLDVEVERAQMAAVRGKPEGGESAPVVNVVKDIVLGRLTGGVRQNPKALFDDALQVILEPRDVDGDAIKAPGSVHIDLFEITPQGLKTPLSSWDISHRELRRLWNEPLIGGPSYRSTLPWKALPTTEKLRVVVRFTTLDGKLFEAEREFSIKLPDGIVTRPGLPVGIPGYCPPPARAAADPRGDETRRPHQADAPAPKIVEKSAPTPTSTGPAKTAAGIPVIQLPPREFPEGDVKPPPNETLPPPSAPTPSLEGGKAAGEVLPPPRTTPATKNPIQPGTTATPVPRSAAATVPATGPTTPLTSPPPQSWRGRPGGLVQVSYSDEPPVKLSRPVPAREVSDQ